MPYFPVSASRTLRNQAEKQRRDKLNYHVSEIASLVPFVERAQKKVDKTSVLRLAASYLRMHQGRISNLFFLLIRVFRP